MKKTQRIELFRNIKNTFVSFISILLFVALSVSLYSGLVSSSAGLAKTIQDTAEKGNIHDIQIVFPYGMTESDLEAISKVEGVDDIEGQRTAFRFLQDGYDKRYVRINSITDKINTPIYVQGRLPDKAGEIALSADWAKKNGFKIGDVIAFTDNSSITSNLLRKVIEYNGNSDDFKDLYSGKTKAPEQFTVSEFEITALMESPEYLCTDSNTLGFSTSGTVELATNMYVAGESFNDEAFYGYTQATVRCNELRGLSYTSDEYISKVNALAERIKAVTDKMAEERSTQVRGNLDAIGNDIEKELDDALLLINEADAKAAEGKEQIESGRRQLSDAHILILDGERKLAEGKEVLEKAKTELDAGKKTLSENKNEFDKKLAELNEAEKKFDEANNLITTAEALYNKATGLAKDISSKVKSGAITVSEAIAEIKESNIVPEIYDFAVAHKDSYKDLLSFAEQLVNELNEEDYDSVQSLLNAVSGKISAKFTELKDILKTKRAELDDAEKKAADAKKTLADYTAKLNDAETQYNNGLAEYSKKAAELSDARKKYDDGIILLAQKEKELSEGLEQIESGRKEYSNGKKQYDDFIAATSAINNFGCSVLTRNQNQGMVVPTVIGEMLNKVRFTMAGLFLVVGLLVCYSSITRMVSDQIVRIGTKRALGLKKKEILSGYMLYSVTVLVAGCILGLIIGLFVFQPILLSSSTKAYVVSDISISINVIQSVIICVAQFAAILLVTWLSIRKILKKTAVEMLQGANKPSGKVRFYEKFKFWEKLPLLTKTIINNCVNDKKRVIGTIIGVAGCTALIVTAFTLRFDVFDSFERHFNDLFHFDGVIIFDNNTENAQAEIEKLLTDRNIPHTPIEKNRLFGKMPDGSNNLEHTMTFTNKESFSRLVNVFPVVSNGAEPYSGVWQSYNYANFFGTDKDRKVQIMDLSGTKTDVSFDGFYESYITRHTIIMSPDAYAEIFGKEVVPNSFLIDTTGIDLDALKKELSELPGYVTTSDYYEETKLSFKIFESISNAMVGIFAGLSVVMAFLVLLNLFSMAIQEKRRELIVLMINGFSVKDAKKYIYMDTIFLTVLGIIAGIVLGGLVGIASIKSLESFATVFLHNISWKACLIGAVGSSVLSVIMSIISLRKIDKFKLADINKA